jgi:hypothetical protein
MYKTTIKDDIIYRFSLKTNNQFITPRVTSYEIEVKKRIKEESIEFKSEQ